MLSARGAVFLSHALDLIFFLSISAIGNTLQFVDFTEIMPKETSQAEKEDQFALEALRKIPAQYSTIIDKWIRYVSGEETDAVRCYITGLLS